MPTAQRKIESPIVSTIEVPLGVLTPKPVEIDELVAGDVGFLIANIKNVADTKIGDTITEERTETEHDRYVDARAVHAVHDVERQHDHRRVRGEAD